MSKIFLVLMILIVQFVNPVGSFSAEANNDCSNNEIILSELNSENLLNRYNALAKLNYMAETCRSSEIYTDAILNICQKEKMVSTKIEDGELVEGYYSELVTALGNTKDQRAIPCLMEFIEDGASAAKNLLKIGEPAIDPLIEKLDDEKIWIRSEAAYALSIFIDPSSKGNFSNSKEVVRIKNALIRQLNDKRNQYPGNSSPNYEIQSKQIAKFKKNLVKCFGFIAISGDNTVVTIIENISNNDNFLEKHKNGKTIFTYPVRDEARKILKELEKRNNMKSINQDIKKFPYLK